MKKIISFFTALTFSTMLFTGCTGIITGHEYKKEDLVIVYKVIKHGVVTFMTPEEIQAAELDKVDIFVTDSYKLLTPDELSRERAREKSIQETK